MRITKRLVLIAITVVMAFSIVACGQTTTTTPTTPSTVPTEPIVHPTKPTGIPTAPTEPTAPTPPPTESTTIPTEPTQEVDNSVHYISDRKVQYDEVKDEYIVFFGLQNKDKQYVSSSGFVKIQIVDDSGESIYDGNMRFDEDDFSDWTNKYWDSSRYLCAIYVDRKEIDGAISNDGILKLIVYLDDGTWFGEEALSIDDLPTKDVHIIIPELPLTYQDLSHYSYISTVQISKLECETKIIYDGTATLTVEVVMKLLSKTDRLNESSTVRVGYKLYDSDGVVVDSGHIYSNPIAVGESSREDFIIFDLDPRDTYTLVFYNAS